MASMLPCYEMDRIAKNVAFDGAKIPHGIANPVLAVFSGQVCVCYLAYAYTKKDIDDKIVPPPSKEVFMDIVSGGVIAIEQCFDPKYDRDDETSRKFYSSATCGLRSVAAGYLDEMHGLFEQVCQTYADEGVIDMNKYQLYLSMLYAITPVGYCEFYREIEHDFLSACM